jgi:hypothetical protein
MSKRPHIVVDDEQTNEEEPIAKRGVCNSVHIQRRNAYLEEKIQLYEGWLQHKGKKTVVQFIREHACSYDSLYQGEWLEYAKRIYDEKNCDFFSLFPNDKREKPVVLIAKLLFTAKYGSAIFRKPKSAPEFRDTEFMDEFLDKVRTPDDMQRVLEAIPELSTKETRDIKLPSFNSLREQVFQELENDHASQREQENEKQFLYRIEPLWIQRFGAIGWSKNEQRIALQIEKYFPGFLDLSVTTLNEKQRADKTKLTKMITNTVIPSVEAVMEKFHHTHFSQRTTELTRPWITYRAEVRPIIKWLALEEKVLSAKFWEKVKKCIPKIQ